MTIVTRFAPSPTGYLHIGGARTALFSWLLAKSQGGKFLLRVEDTDRERSTQEATDAILEAMAWLDLAAEGETVFQSQRFALYNSHIDRLLESGHAYWCQCTPQEVEAMREKARAEGKKPKYDGRCRELGLGPGEADTGRVVRFKGPQDGVSAFDDMVKGPTAVQNAELDDMILRRSDGAPTYNLAVVVDDHDMGVTTVLRGDDHVANTPRQILLYKALGWDVPKFGHVPMILGPDKAKLSKRHGALSVMEYKKLGYLPEALVNYLA
ncbi:MAG: glutamate--tRNA ligase, partial [Desulfovibrio sp.]|nr:glutamate--tRNA ligase [Desulfovibrio sp.]